MNSDYENRLATLVDQELQALPDAKAPLELRSRVMSAIEARSARRSAWSAWPVGVRAATLLILLAGFAGLCFGAWEVREAEVYAIATGWLGGFFAPVATLGNLIGTLVSALVLAVKSLNGAVVAGLFAIAALIYFSWVALGTLWFRITFARR